MEGRKQSPKKQDLVTAAKEIMNQEGIKTGKSEEGKRIRGGLNSTSKKDILDVPFSNTE